MRRFTSAAAVLSVFVAVLVLAAPFAESRGGGFGGGGGGRRGKGGRNGSAQQRELVANAVRRDNLRRARASLS